MIIKHIEPTIKVNGIEKEIDQHGFYTGVRKLRVEVEDVKLIPHIHKVGEYHTLITMPGRPPLCLRCGYIGHVRQNYVTPYSTEECVPTYANTVTNRSAPQRNKVITNRLSKILHKIIDIDQTSSIPGRSILDTCHLFRNIIDYMKAKPTKLAFISLDQEKAFDNISHTYLFKVLQQFCFSSKFIDWIKLLYTNIQSIIILNNHISSSFPIHKGVRQGCPLSPLLYVLVFEILLTKIRSSPNVNGLKLPGTNEEAKLSAFADDVTLILTDYKSIFSTFQILE